MDLRQLSYFVQVCRCKSYTKAAMNSFISQQGLSISLKRLEDELNTKLLTREDDGYHPTSDGLYLYQRASEILDILNECDNYFNAKNNPRKTPVIACVIGIIGYFPGFFSKYTQGLEGFPKIKLIEGTAKQCDSLLKSGDADMAIIPGPIQNDKNIVEPLFSVPYFMIVHKQNPVASLEQIPIQELKNHPIVIINQEFRFHRIFLDKCAESGFRPDIVFEMDRVSDIFTLVSESPNLVGVSHKLSINHYLRDDMVSIPIIDTPFHWDIQIAYKKDAPPSKSLMNFHTQAIEYFSKWEEHTEL